MKSQLTLNRIALAALLPGFLVSSRLWAENLQAPANPAPVPIEQKSPEPSEADGGATSKVVDEADQVVSAIVDTLKESNHWQRSTEIKSGNVYILRRSTDEPLKPGEIVIFRWRTPTEIRNKAFVYARYPRAQVEHPVPPPAPVSTP